MNCTREFNMLLSETAHQEIEEVAADNGVLMTEVVRLGIGLST